MNLFKQYLEIIQEKRDIRADLRTVKSFISKDQDMSTKNKKDDGQPSLFNIKKNAKKYKGNILYLHGFPDNPSLDITRELESRGFKVINQKIMWGKAFKENKEALMNVLAAKAKKSKLIIGSSFGGYIAFLLTGMTKTPSILINPVISIHTIKKHSGPESEDPNLYFYDKKNKEEYDNNITKITSHFIDKDIYKDIIKNYPSGNEIFFGSGDTLLPPEKTKQTLARLGVQNKFKTFTIKNMGHGHIQYVRHDEPGLFKDMKPIDNEWGAYDFFSTLLDKSNILKKIGIKN